MSTRIIIKNIPSKITEKKLKEIFSKKGEITDIKIIKTKSGKSRQFAFIGFKTEKQAKETKDYYNNTYIETLKIQIDIAKSINDKSLLLLSKSKYSKKKLQNEQKINENEIKKNEIKKNEENNNNNNKKKNKNNLENNTQDRAKAEFFEVMKTRKNANVWGNDDAQIRLAQERLEQEAEEKLQQDIDEHDDDDDDDAESESDNEEYDDIILKKQSKNHSDHETEESDSDSGSDDGIRKGQTKSKQIKSIPKPISDLDFLRGKIKKNITDDSESDSDSNSESESDENNNNESDEDNQSNEGKKQEEKNKNHHQQQQKKIITKQHGTDQMEIIKDDKNDENEEEKEKEEEEEEGRLFLRNLTFACSEDELTELFEKYGPLSQVHIPLNEDKRGKGYGFVQFMIPEHAKQAMKELDGVSFQGRLLHIIPAKIQHHHEANEMNQKGLHGLSSFQKKKEEERRKMAHKREGWNSSYIRSDTVVDALSDKYGVSRGDILDADGVGGGELAVRLAIGETQIIQENKEYFLSHGVDIDALESTLTNSKTAEIASKSKRINNNSNNSNNSNSNSIERSKTTLLIKNLPHDVVSDELEEMFARFGSIDTFLIPPSKTVALIEFTEPTEARKAFTGLAYRRYHHVPLYLEWAPLNTLKKQQSNIKANIDTNNKINSSNKTTTKTTTSTTTTSTTNKTTSSKNEITSAFESTEESSDYSTLYVKNLNFQTTENDLKNHLINRLGINESEIRTISIPKKQTKTGEPISMGFGFIEFRSVQGAVNMLPRINGTRLNEHILDVKPSNKRLSVQEQSLIISSNKSNKRNTNNEDTNENSNETNKLIVRNVAFQATREELKSLFSAFGTIKTIRIPRKIGGVHRGFAFVDFNTKQEATRAMNALSRTHMYGRHLVIEYAKNDEDINEQEKVNQLRDRAESNVRAIIKSSQNKKRKVGEILDSSQQNDGDIMF